MAASLSHSFGHKLDELLKCPVCLDTFREPRTLCCLHTFCTECLEGCRRLLRRDIECPVCKRVSSLPPAGVRGLPTDYRIEQIRDFFNDMQATDGTDRPAPVDSSADPSTAKPCDVCKTQQRVVTASHHCVQCLMQLCDECIARHNSNSVLAAHQLIAVSDARAVLAMFCTKHHDQPIRYFCSECRVTLCSICAIEHDPSHRPEALEQGVLEQYRTRLTDSLRLLTSHLSDVKTRAKRLNAMRQSCQNKLYVIQQHIRDHSEQLVARIRQREAALLLEAQSRFDGALNVDGYGSLAELEFRKSEIEKLIGDVRQLLAGPPLSCLLYFDEIASGVCRLTDASLHGAGATSVRMRAPKSVRFVPASVSDMEIVIGCLQDCSFGSADTMEADEPQSPSTTSSPPHGSADNPSSGTRKRTSSILNAVSPVRKCDSRGCRMKSVARLHHQLAPCGETSDGVVAASSSAADTSATTAIASSSTTDNADAAGTSAASASVTSTLTGCVTQTSHARILFSVNQVGVLQGMILSPVAVAFLDNSDIVIAEDYRVQRFDRCGQSLTVVGWYTLKPAGIAVTRDGLLAVADKASRTVRFYHNDGRDVSPTRRWPERLFGMPAGLAVVKSTGNVVVVDAERRTVTVHAPGTRHMSPALPVCTISSEQLGLPTHVAVDNNGTIFVSDSQHLRVKMFDHTGKFQRQFSLPNRHGNTESPRLPACPYGLCVIGNTGVVAVCDRDGHRVVLMTYDGADAGDLLTSDDGLRYPCDVEVTVADGGNKLVAVVESSSGLMGNEPHHAVKLFTI